MVRKRAAQRKKQRQEEEEEEKAVVSESLDILGQTDAEEVELISAAEDEEDIEYGLLNRA